MFHIGVIGYPRRGEFNSCTIW